MAEEKGETRDQAEAESARRDLGLPRALAELAVIFTRAYEAQAEKILKKVRSYIEERIVFGPLNKADAPKPIGTPHQLRDLRKILEDFHLAFVAGTVGPDTLDPSEIQRLVDSGVLPQDLAFTFLPGAHELPPHAMRIVDEAFYYGHLLSGAKTPAERSRVQEMSYADFAKLEKPQLTQTERLAMEWARHSAGNECRGLGHKISDDFSTSMFDADREQRRKALGIIREEASANIERRETWRKLASHLGHRMKDWARDFQRIAATEKQHAMQEGFAQGLVKRHKDPDRIRVAKQPNPDACPDCVRLHLTEGRGSKPRIFKLSELHANGTNVGRKRQDWKAGVGPVHPWCACELIHVPDGWDFDDEGNLAPESIARSLVGLEDLVKAKGISYKNVPEDTVIIRVADPYVRAEVEKIVAATPKEVFQRTVGVTLITTDHPRVGNPLDEHDLAYWTGNEIRLMQMLPAKKIARVLPHEIGHSLNVYLIGQMGSEDAVKRWHRKLWVVSKKEGWVSDYAKKEPIENAAEVSRLYLYDRPNLMLNWPRQFAIVHAAYRNIFRRAVAA